MTEENKATLLQLRTKILDDIIPLTEGDVFEPSQKFVLLLSSARVSNDPKTLVAAYEAAKQIEDTAQRADALLEALEEVDVQLGDITFDEAVEPAAPPVQNEQPTEMPQEEQPTEAQQ